MKGFFLWLCAFFPFPLLSFVVDPWLSSVGEFILCTSPSYSYYPSVNRGSDPSSYSSHDLRLDLNLRIQCWPRWEGQLQVDFLRTRELRWGGERVGGQLRYLILDDVEGDPVSMAVGGTLFYVPTRALRDVSSPYHAQGNAEVGISIGKEMDRTFDWRYRFWGFGGIGIANRGAPWLRPLVAMEGKFAQRHKIKLFAQGYVGLGREQKVDIRSFYGYGAIHHRSVEMGINYTYLLSLWGAFTFQYAYRVYARSYPCRAQTVTVEYRLPFSLL